MLLFISDGESTDGDPLPIACEIAASGVQVISCFVAASDTVEPRVLHARAGDMWPPGATSMFEVASVVHESDPVGEYLRDIGWTTPLGARLFAQINHSSILAEFVQVILAPIDAEHSLGRFSRTLNPGYAGGASVHGVSDRRGLEGYDHRKPLHPEPDAAWAACWSQCRSRFEALAFRRLGDPHDAADAVADAYADALQRRGRQEFGPDCSARGGCSCPLSQSLRSSEEGCPLPLSTDPCCNRWIRYALERAIHRVVEDRHRRLRLRRAWSAEAKGANASQEDCEPRSSARRALQLLCPYQRRLLTLRYYDELSSAEIAALTGISRATVASRLTQALGELRPQLCAELYESRCPQWRGGRTARYWPSVGVPLIVFHRRHHCPVQSVDDCCCACSGRPATA